MNYWEKRALESRIATVNAAERSVAELGRSIARATSDLQKEAADILDSIDGDIAKAKRLLTSRELQKYRMQQGALIERYIGDDRHADAVLDLLYKQDKVNRLDSMIGQMDALTYELYGKISGSIEQTMTDAAERSYNGTFHAVETYLGRGYEWAHIDEQKLNVLLNSDWSGKYWSDRLWGHVSDFNRLIKDTVTRGVLTGSPIRDMATELMGRTNQLRHRCETIIRTEVAHVAGEATAMSYAEAGIEEYTYLATLDLKTSEICRSLDQKTFPLDEKQEGVNYPPMHPNCRSTTYFSITKDSHSMRAARDPVTGKSVEVPGDWDYARWYQARVATKNIDLPDNLVKYTGLAEDIKDGIKHSIEKYQQEYDIKIDEIVFGAAENVKAPMQFVPVEQDGLFKSQLLINKDFTWNASLEELNERIYNKNYLKGMLAAKDLDGLVAHEMAHCMTFQECETWEDFVTMERHVRKQYVPGISTYNDIERDGAESIAEAFVRHLNKEDVPDREKELVDEYVLRKKK